MKLTDFLQQKFPEADEFTIGLWSDAIWLLAIRDAYKPEQIYPAQTKLTEKGESRLENCIETLEVTLDEIREVSLEHMALVTGIPVEEWKRMEAAQKAAKEAEICRQAKDLRHCKHEHISHTHEFCCKCEREFPYDLEKYEAWRAGN